MKCDSPIAVSKRIFEEEERSTAPNSALKKKDEDR
jgi:hypothetical protein